MRELGTSNKFFYYNQAYKSTFNIRFRLKFKEPIQLEYMKEAASEAIQRYPELGGEIVLKDNKLMIAPNDRPVAFYEENGENHDLGSEDTNGYMFYCMYGEDYIVLSYYHGLTDIVGFMMLTKTILYLYAQKTGFQLSEEELEELLSTIRDEKGLSAGDDIDDMYDPYRKFMKADSKPSFTFNNPGAFSIPTEQYPEDCDYVHSTLIELKTADFIKKTKEYGVSFVPLLVDIISGAIDKQYEADKPVIAMVPVNLRPYYGSKSLVNFSDGVMIPYEKDMHNLDVNERCKKHKEIMQAQLQKENFDLVLDAKVKAVEGFEALDKSVCEIQKERGVLPPKGTVRPLTYAMTYPGKIDFTSGLNRMLSDYYMEPSMRAYATIVYTFGDTMRINCICRQDDETFSKCICGAFEEMGFDISYTDKKHLYPDQMKLHRFREV